MKNNLRLYMDELRQLCRTPPQEDALLPLEIVSEIGTKAKPLRESHHAKYEIEFDVKSSPEFRLYVQKLANANSSPIYIWTSRSNALGPCKIDSILDFNFDFEFGVNKEGIIVLLSSDLKDEIILDFSHDSVSGKDMLEIELFGENWPHVTL